VLKTAPPSRLTRERDTLQQLADCPQIRQLLDHGEQDPPFLVLEHLDEDSLRLSDKGKLSRSDIKSIARSTLQALSSLRAKGIAHTGT
jgi:serine/threonine protein kinase